VFETFNPEDLVKESQACGRVLSGPNGLDSILEVISDAIPDRLHETAYALAVEVAASDLTVRAEEIRFLDLLAEKLHVDKLVCAALERGARARYRAS